jgi:hypothetical protein
MFRKSILAAVLLAGTAVSGVALADAETKDISKNSYQQVIAVQCSSYAAVDCTATFPVVTANTVITWVPALYTFRRAR